jgi:cell division protease FtsH
MKFPKLPKKSGQGPNRSRIALLIAACLCLAFLLPGIFQSEAPDDTPWAYSALPFAQDISLTQAADLLKEDPDGRRAAIVGYTIVIETKAGAGNSPDLLASAFEDHEEALIEKYRAQSETEQSASDTDVDETAQIADPTPSYEVSSREIELDVVKTRIPSFTSGYIDDLVANSKFDIEIIAHPGEAGAGSAGIESILSLGIMIIIAGAFLYMIIGRGNMGTSKSFTVIKPSELTAGLDDVAGIGIAKDDVCEVIEFMKNPKDASRLGGRMPRGALFDGPPGTGKTLLAKAVAKEAGVTFISVDASSLSALYVGLGAIKVQAIFRKARKMAPCILFIDEIDAMAKKRSSGNDRGSDEKENTLNAILTKLDGFESRDGIFVIGATNRPEILDPALTRPGRIDRRITMTVPDITGREEILKVHTRNMVLGSDVDLKPIAASTYGLTGAQLANLVNEAALNAGRNRRDAILQEDLQYGRDRILLPRSSSQIRLLEDDRHLTAVHEAGHAVVAALSQHADPIEKATILPQGNALGFVMQAPDRDFVFHSKARLRDRIRVAVAGRAAENLVFGDDMVTTGAASDIQQATAVARAMVTQYGMSEAGFVAINPRDPVLCETQGKMFHLIKSIIGQEQVYVEALLKKNRAALDAVAHELESRETMSGDEVREIVRAQKSSD